MALFGWFKKHLIGADKNELHQVNVNQQHSRAGRRTVRGDLCSGNYTIKGKLNIAPGSFIGGDLRVEATASSVEDIALLDVEVQGRVFRNGEDITEQFHQLRSVR